LQLGLFHVWLKTALGFPHFIHTAIFTWRARAIDYTGVVVKGLATISLVGKRRLQRSASIPARVIASCFGLLGFIAAIIVGIAAGNPFVTILWRAILVMLACWIVGRVIGSIMQSTIEDHIAKLKEQQPIPDEDAVKPPDQHGADSAQAIS